MAMRSPLLVAPARRSSGDVPGASWSKGYVVDAQVVAYGGWVECVGGLELSEKAEAHHASLGLRRVA